MSSRVFPLALCVVLSALPIFAQIEPTPTPTRQRVIIVGQKQNSFTVPAPTPMPTPIPLATPVPEKKVVVVTTTNLPPAISPTPYPRPLATPIPGAIPSDSPISPAMPIVLPPLPLPSSYKTMSFGQLRDKINETKRLMQTRPMQTALTDSFLTTEIVRLGFYDWKTAQIDFVPLTKSVFLKKDTILPTLSSNGKNVTVRIVRANGVNTAVVIYDELNQPHTPLIVQYPIEKLGRYVETAYYISAHPGIVTPEVINAGNLYVRNTIDIARSQLAAKGHYISPQIADIAERLSTVEHVDHQRFWSESQANLYNEIFTLYALNEGNTYRYSVSSAGAGGMVQMIPRLTR